MRCAASRTDSGVRRRGPRSRRARRQEPRRDLEDVQRGARVALRERHDRLHGPRVDLDAEAAKAAVGVDQRATHDRLELRLGQPLEHVHPAPRQQGRDHLEGRILGRRADQGHGAALDVGQERVLLSLVEAVDLVDEQDRALAAERQTVLGLGDQAADLLDSREHGGERREVGPGVRGEEGGKGRLPGARRAPQDHRVKVARLDGGAEQSPGPEQVRLANELVERLRPHPLGQRGRFAPALARRLLEQLHAAP